MLMKYATLWSFTLPLSLATCIYYLLLFSGLFTLALVGRAVSIFFSFFFSAFFFGIAQAFKRRFCSGICYFSLFLLPTMLRFWGSNMLQRGDYARELCYFVVVHASPFPLQHVCIIYFSFPAYLVWP